MGIMGSIMECQIILINYKGFKKRISIYSIYIRSCFFFIVYTSLNHDVSK